MKFFKKNKGIFISLFISLVLVISIMSIKNIYPFGKFILNVDTLHNVDIPVYYRIWDVFHGVSNIFINWNIGMSDLSYVLANGGLNPSTWIVALFPKSLLLESVSYMLIVKVMLITLITYICISKSFKKLNEFYKILFTIIYTFSNTLFLSLGNLVTLDMMMCIPLIVLGYVSLFKENKKILYVSSLVFTLITNYYNYFMLFILLVGSIILSSIFLCKEDKLKNIFRMLLYTFISYGIASVVLIPILNLYYDSYYFELNFLFDTIDIEKLMTRLVFIFSSVLPIVLIFKQLFVKKDKNVNLFIISMMLFLLVSIVIEPICLILHNNIYVNSIFEYSYVINYLLVFGSLYYISNNYVNKNKKNNINVISCIILVGLYLLFMILLKNDIMSDSIIFGMKKYAQMGAYIFLFVIAIFMCINIFKNDKLLTNVFMIVIGIINIYVFSYYIISNSIFLSSTKYTYSLNDKFNIVNDGYKYVNNSNKVNYNYSYILNVPSNGLDNLNTRVSDAEFKNTYKYAGKYYVVNSVGGNIFIDRLLHNKYYISDSILNDDMYELVDSSNGINLYQSKKNLDLIIPYSGKYIEEDSGSIVNNTNNLYKVLFNKDDNIMEKVNVVDDGDNYIVDVKKGNIYYLSLVPELYSKAYIDLSNLGVEVYYIYSTDSSMMSMISTDEDKEIIINKESNGLTNIEVGYINIDKYNKFIDSIDSNTKSVDNKKNKIIYEYSSDKDTNLLLPIKYSEGIVVKVNGVEIVPSRNVFNMLSIYVNKGDNKIEVSYKLKYLNIGIIVSIISLLTFVILLVVDRRKNL